jgi:hypothetical protein
MGDELTVGTPGASGHVFLELFKHCGTSFKSISVSWAPGLVVYHIRLSSVTFCLATVDSIDIA